MDAAKNFAKGTLIQGYDDNATSIDVNPGEGGRFPAVPFNAVWWDASDYSDPADDPTVEIVRVTAISGDTLTITRAQEGTGASTHELSGKSYKLIAGLTAKGINDGILPITRIGNDYEINAPEGLLIETVGSLLASVGGSTIRFSANAAGVVLEMSSGFAAIGDVDENNTGVMVKADDNLGQVSLKGKIGTDQTAAATTPGTVTKKLQIFDLAGNSLGFIPIYNSIT